MNKKAKELFDSDMKRYGGNASRYMRSFHKYFRLAASSKNGFIKKYYRHKFYKISLEHGIEIPSALQCGKGLYIAHPYNITINPRAIIGNNVNLHKGVTIGKEHRGKRKGTPTIGNCVYIGINAIVVGNITIGDDVLIAPNAYVNCDVPSHSIVFGNPCIIKPRENATEDYVIRTV